jgi:ABC-type ATPase involved in cell division
MAAACIAALDAVDVDVSGAELFRSISLRVQPGALTVLAGPGSSGKSIILRMMWGALRPAKGAVIGDGRDLTRASFRRWAAWRRKIGIVCDDFPVVDGWAVDRNLAAALRAAGKAPADRINRELAQWNLLNKRHALAGSLSDSERARLVLARAFVRNPIAAFLDEPLAKTPRSEYSELIGIIKRKTLAGTGVLVATTAGEEWEKAADESYWVEAGRLFRRDRVSGPLIR